MFLLGVALVGMALGFLVYYVYLLIFDKNELEDNSKEVDIMEHWGKTGDKNET